VQYETLANDKILRQKMPIVGKIRHRDPQKQRIIYGNFGGVRFQFERHVNTECGIG
jgi:hypothetical protein